jgi:glycosyltransferase involved in cell wall biosynthesis
VWFLGTRSDTHKLLQAADVFALSSLSEGLSVALIEAAACGLPIVATDVGGNPEVVNAPHGGRLVPPSNPEAMAVALREVLGNDVLRSTMSRAAREHALTRFSVKQMLNAYLALYENCVQKRGLSLTSKC